MLELGGSIGDIPLRLPVSFAARLDLVTAWSDSPNRIELARLCAASIVICTEIKGAPRYKVESARPVAFGGTAIDWLVGKGVAPQTIYKVGPSIIVDLVDSLPSEAKVEEATDFSEESVEE